VALEMTFIYYGSKSKSLSWKSFWTEF